MWDRYDAGVVRSELAVLHEHGLNVTRSFFYWPDFMPAAGTVDHTAVSRFADFLDAHTEVGMGTIPTFIVGHMSGENWDPVWRAGRDLYRDVWLVNQQAWFIEAMTREFAAHPAVVGWLISNEMPIYGGEDEISVVSAWANLMVQAVRSGGGTQPVSIGDGAWGVEVSGHDNGYSVRELARITDFVGPHVYKMETDAVRQYLKAGFVCELAAVGGKPVVMEEFGLSSDFASAENSGHYYRQVLHNSLLAGATGWIAWNNTDYDNLIGQDPYRHHPFEMHFGITDNDGTPKAPLAELRDFAATLQAIDLPNCARRDAAAGLIVSEYAERDAPVSNQQSRQFIIAGLEQAYVTAREADIPLAFVREVDGVESGLPLYLLPSTKQLSGPGWMRLRELASDGAMVYVSYSPGDSEFQRGPWWTATEELFGVAHQLRYGLVDPVVDDVVEMTLVAEFGSLRPGQVLRFAVGGSAAARAYLPVVATDGTVVAVDQHGHPALVVKRHAQGAMVLGTFGVEFFAAATAGANPDDSWRLYDALAQAANIRRDFRADSPEILVDSLRHADGREFVWLVSQSGERQTAKPLTDGRPGALRVLGTEQLLTEVDIDPWGVVVAEFIEGAQA